MAESEARRTVCKGVQIKMTRKCADILLWILAVPFLFGLFFTVTIAYLMIAQPYWIIEFLN